MTDGETRFHLLAMCNNLREQLKQTEKLTSAVEMLLARDPELKVQYEAVQKPQPNGDVRSSPPELIGRALLQLEREIQVLGGWGRL